VVSEHSRDCAPLIPGKHFVSGRAQDLALLADLLLDDDDRLAELRASAYELVRESLPIERSIDRLLAVAETLPAAPPASRPSPSSHSTASNPDELAELVMAAADRELQPIRAALKGVTIDMLETRRALSMLQVLALGEDPQQPLVAAETESYGAVRPRVSVAISLHNYALEIVEALDSVAASEHDAFEILILDDASVDDSAQVVSSYLADRPWLPARLLRHRANRGLGRTRNALVAQARGDFVFILDADNTVYPTALARLEAGLTEDPEASFAYAVSAILVNGEPQGLLSRHAWDPARLRDGNYIDAMALIRRDRLIEIGGYGEDPRLLGCEDYDLWCRFAEAGQRGVHVPQMLTTYSSRADGMVESVTKLDLSVVLSLIAARSPCLFAGPVNG
jgi:hypothetical protein